MTETFSRTFIGGGIVTAGRFVEQYRKRRLQRVREVADMHARAIDDFAIGFQQRIHFTGERGNFFRKFSFELFGAARANGGKCFGYAGERPETEANLKPDDQNEGDAE